MNFQKILGFAVGPIGAAILGLVTVPLMAWSFMPEDIGRINLFNFIISFGLLFFVLGLDVAYVREYHSSQNKLVLFKTCFIPGFLLLLFFCFVGYFYFSKIGGWLLGVDDKFIYLIICFCLIVNYISRFLSLILRLEERGFSYSLSQISSKILQVFLLLCFVFFIHENNFLTLLLINAVCLLFAFFIYLWSTKSIWILVLKVKMDLMLLKSLLKFGFPLIFSGLAYWGLSASSSFMLSKYSSFEELGIYSVAGSFASVAAIFQSIVTIIWGPTFFKWMQQGIDMRKMEIIHSQALTVVCFIFAGVGSLSWVIDFLLPVHYDDVKYLVLCSIIPPLLYTLSEITGIGIAASKKTIYLVWVSLFALVVNLLCNYFLIPLLGAKGAVISNAIAYTFLFILRTEVSIFLWKKFSRNKIYINLFFVVLLSVLTVLLGSDIGFSYSIIWILFLILMFFIFKKELKYQISFLKKYI